ncbi:hypothetical protein MLD38_000233 [Melastoma candidum]|uniref:Uncharacterized protein n=1 Tax=Melastoma candidum TaxID=119954 RepID=A0ACB9S9K0_9MYRT|nr:hypothetical protein MLD38_000233 [Melastoma candidum]
MILLFFLTKTSCREVPPCHVSPSGRDLQHKDHSGPIEILGFSDHSFESKLFIKEIVKARKNGLEPIPVFGGLGGAYYLRNSVSENVAIVKPTDEEPYAPNNPKGFVGKALRQPGLKPSVRVGEMGFREVAAYLLDYDHFAKVPFTVLVKITHSIFNVNNEVGSNKRHGAKQISKIASLQQKQLFLGCLSEIGEMMSREFQGHEERPSEFELVCMGARHMLDKRGDFR